MRVLASVILYRLRRAAVGIAFAEDRIHRAALDLVVAGLDVLLVIIRGNFGIVWQREPTLLQFGNGGLQLRDRCADIWKLDDIRLGLERERTQFGEGILRLLLRRQAVCKYSQDAASKRNVPHLHRDPRMLREGLDDWQQRIGSKKRGFVGFCVDDGRLGRHMRKGSY